MQTVAVLFARRDSVYKSLPGCDVFDVDRDALTWLGGAPVVAHPPCRLWGRLRTFSTAPAKEKELARWAVGQVRRWGGVLEHPAHSTLWPDCYLPLPGQWDAFAGWTLPVEQFHWGHKAAKATWLYVVGCEPQRVPVLPQRIGYPEFVVGRHRWGGGRPEIPKSEREKTPPDFARWLCDLARRCWQGERPC